MSSRCANKLQSKRIFGSTPEEISMSARLYFQREENVFEFARVLACLSDKIPENDFADFTDLLREKRKDYCSFFVSQTLGIPDLSDRQQVKRAFAEWYVSKKQEQGTVVKLKQCLVDLGIFKTPYKAEQFLRQTSSDTCSRYLLETGILEPEIQPSKDYVLPRLFIWYSKFGQDKTAVSRVMTCLVVLGVFESKGQAEQQLKNFERVVSTVKNCVSFLGTLGLWQGKGIVLEEDEMLKTRQRVALFLEASRDEALSQRVRECATLAGVLGEEEEIRVSETEAYLVSPKVVDSLKVSEKKKQCRDYFMDIGVFPKDAEFIHPSEIHLYGQSLQYAFREANILQKLRILECAHSLGIMSQEKAKRKEKELEKCLKTLRERGISGVPQKALASLGELREIEMKVRSGVWDEDIARCVQKVLGSSERPEVKIGTLVKKEDKFDRDLKELDTNISRSDAMAYFLMVLKVLDLAPKGMLVPEVMEFADDLAARVDIWFEETENPVLKHEVLVAAGSLGVLNHPRYERLAEQLREDSLEFLKKKGITKKNLPEVFSSSGSKSFGILRVAGMAGLLSSAEVDEYLEALEPQRRMCIAGLKKAAFLPYVQEDEVDTFMPLAAHRFMMWAEKEYEASTLDETEFLNMASCITLVNSEEQGSLVFQVPEWKTIRNIQKDTVDRVPSGILLLEKEGVVEKGTDITDIDKVAESINERFALVFDQKSPEKKLLLLSAVASTGIAEAESLQELREEVVSVKREEEPKAFLVTSSPPKQLPKGVTCTVGTDGRYYWFMNGKRTKGKKEWDREACEKRAFLKTSKKPKKLPGDVMCIEGKDGKFYWLKKGRLVFSGKDRPCKV
ncbi:hypothetical protein [Brazilian marseillevirus]|uniref:hypothetical protein n=1 Tax=Brazilian marseillevirus TaxID=1813599 RepID=UPI0007824556|nr:hypothetical protein A3303_gp456 [Brazilian marseillevirus]AMQ10964.1 hypothetical protein [Brazilian marseillevirus]